jgi:hypothetical protein
MLIFTTIIVIIERYVLIAREMKNREVHVILIRKTFHTWQHRARSWSFLYSLALTVGLHVLGLIHHRPNSALAAAQCQFQETLCTCAYKFAIDTNNLFLFLFCLFPS